MPGSSLDVMMFSLFVVAFSLQTLGNGKMSVLKKVCSIFSNEADHAFILSSLLIHINGQVGLFDCEIEFFCLFP